MAEILVAEFDDKQVRGFLENMAKNLRNVKNGIRDYANLISINVFQDIMEHFKNEEGPDGKWPIWSVSYMAAIQGRVAFRKFGKRTVALDPYQMEAYGIKPPRKPGMILQNTGRLRNGFTPRKYRANSSGITWYNNAKTKTGFPYAAAHDEGGNKLPQRSFMWLSKEGMEQVELQTIWYLLEKEGGM